MNRLLSRLDDLVLSATAPSTTDIDLRNFLECSLFARQGRAEAARERSRERSEALRARIRTAAGVLPLGFGLSALARIVQRRMGTGAASQRTIRDELLSMREQFGKTGTETSSVLLSTDIEVNILRSKDG